MSRRARAKRASTGGDSTSVDENRRELVLAIEELHALLADVDAYLDAAHRVLPEVGRVETEEGRRLFGFSYKYVEDAHALGQRAVRDAKRLAELAIAGGRGSAPRSVRNVSRPTDRRRSRR